LGTATASYGVVGRRLDREPCVRQVQPAAVLGDRGRGVEARVGDGGADRAAGAGGVEFDDRHLVELVLYDEQGRPAHQDAVARRQQRAAQVDRGSGAGRRVDPEQEARVGLVDDQARPVRRAPDAVHVEALAEDEVAGQRQRLPRQ
jgi:hypothetical protein